MRAVSNSISYIVLLGISLVLVAYSLNVFLKFQTVVREPMRASVDAVESASDDFMATMSGGIDGGVFLSSGNYSLDSSGNLSIGIETFPPYMAGSPAMLQAGFINSGPGTALVSHASLSVIKGNSTVYSKEYSNLAVGYKLVKDIVFTPETEGEYTVRMNAGGTSAESNITVMQYGTSQGRGIYGSRNFTVLGLEQDIFSYDLRERRFDGRGSGSRWNVSILGGFWFDSFEFIGFQRNYSLPHISGQFVGFNISRFNVSEGNNSFSSSAGFSIPVGRSAGFLDLLIGSTCAGGLNVTLSYPSGDSRLPLAYGRDICRSDVSCPAPGVLFESGTVGHLELQVVSVSLQDRLERITFSPDCGFVLAGASLRNRTWHAYGNTSSVFLFVEKTDVQYVNGRSLEGQYEDSLKVYDATNDFLNGIKEFRIETDRDIAAPYILYTEVLNSSIWNYSLPGGLLESAVSLDVSLPYRKEVFGREVSFSSSEGRYGTRANSWRFGAVFDDSPELAIGFVSKNISSWYDSYYPYATLSGKVNGNRILPDPAGGDVRLARVFVLERLGRENSFGFDYLNNYGDASFSAAGGFEAYFGAVELERFGKSISRGCSDCETTRAGNSETLTRSFNTTVPPEVIAAYVMVNSDLPDYNCYAFSAYPSSGFYLELAGRSYSARSYQAVSCNWCCSGTHLAGASLLDISGLFLPHHNLEVKTRLVTDSVSSFNDNPHTGGDAELLFVKRKPLRMDGRELYRDSLVPLNSSFRFRGTGRVSGVLKASYLDGGPVVADVGFFRSALLVLEPEAGVDGLEVLVNGRRARNASVLLLPEKIDISKELIPLGRNVFEFLGRNGSLDWRIVLD